MSFFLSPWDPILKVHSRSRRERGQKTMKSEVIGISERVKKTRISLKDNLAIIDMTLEGQAREHEVFFPYEAFEGLNDLIERTVHGTKIERFRLKEGRPPSHTFEIHTEGGETLGYLNMIYLSKP